MFFLNFLGLSFSAAILLALAPDSNGERIDAVERCIKSVPPEYQSSEEIDSWFDPGPKYKRSDLIELSEELLDVFGSSEYEQRLLQAALTLANRNNEDLDTALEILVSSDLLAGSTRVKAVNKYRSHSPPLNASLIAPIARATAYFYAFVGCWSCVDLEKKEMIRALSRASNTSAYVLEIFQAGLLDDTSNVAVAIRNSCQSGDPDAFVQAVKLAGGTNPENYTIDDLTLIFYSAKLGSGEALFRTSRIREGKAGNSVFRQSSRSIEALFESAMKGNLRATNELAVFLASTSSDSKVVDLATQLAAMKSRHQFQPHSMRVTSLLQNNSRFDASAWFTQVDAFVAAILNNNEPTIQRVESYLNGELLRP